ncbi:TPA: hypothetical protein ACH3X3_005114 [Trebouxia sp. C0006]
MDFRHVWGNSQEGDAASPLSSVAGDCLVQGYKNPESAVYSRQRGWGQHITEGQCAPAETPKRNEQVFQDQQSRNKKQPPIWTPGTPIRKPVPMPG